MKKINLLIHVAAAGLFCGNAPAEADALSTPHITVNGTAVKEVVPDRLHWSLEVKNTGLELPKVADQHGKKVTALLDLLKISGVPDKDVQTARMEFSENRVYRRDEWVKEGYQAQTNVSFKLEDLGKYQQLWTALANLSGVSVADVSLDHSKRIELNKETRKVALQMAREKAAAMAEVLGSKVGEPLAIEEGLIFRAGSGGMANSTANINIGAERAAPQGENFGILSPGSIPITIRVRVTFRLLNAGN